ncbi:cytochrome c oxidase assembly protein subunit 15 [Rhizobiales bacterium GAS188]|nr:cytochrome c oxidase assembly protein subunit 15 [Rhizobiales bacterium GAS188]
MTVIPANSAAMSLPADAARRMVPGWVSAWLWSVAFLVILMVMVGGATRLTGSGLSITEWRPVSGAVPPLSEADWVAEFARYQASPQYHLLNAGIGLADFKSIFWWEWGHRQLGRFIGLVYAAGFLIGLARRAFPLGIGLRLAGMGLLLGFQGLIGWVMVASGLKAGMTAVEPVDLAAHLFFASLFLVTLVAMATRLGSPAQTGRMPGRATARLPRLIVIMVLLQLVLGALVAGSHAGLIYNSWPSMDGRFVPPLQELFAGQPWWANFFENVTLIQLDHRLGAYLLVVLALWNAASWSKRGRDPKLGRLAQLLALLVLAQMGLGIVTLVFAVPLAAALGHQLLAMFVLIAAVRLATLARKPLIEAGPAAASPLAAHVATR